MNIEKRREFQLKKYIIIFLITTTIFFLGFYLSNILNNKRIINVSDVEDKMSINILSSEVQFALLKDANCNGITEKTVLSNELKELGKKLSFMEHHLGPDNNEVIKLKKKYTLLEIKDIMLMKEITKKCHLKPINILYFYSNKKCEDCKKQGYVLTRLSQDNPRLRIYTFDYDLNLTALKTLKNVKKITKNKLPILVIDNKVYYGFQEIEKIKKLLPKLKIIKKHFLNYFNGDISNIENQCSDDKQCIIDEKITTLCGIPKPINVNNTSKNIQEYFEKEKEFTKGVTVKCDNNDKIKYKAVCDLEDNICKIVENTKK